MKNDKKIEKILNHVNVKQSKEYVDVPARRQRPDVSFMFLVLGKSEVMFVSKNMGTNENPVYEVGYTMLRNGVYGILRVDIPSMDIIERYGIEEWRFIQIMSLIQNNLIQLHEFSQEEAKHAKNIQ